MGGGRHLFTFAHFIILASLVELYCNLIFWRCIGPLCRFTLHSSPRNCLLQMVQMWETAHCKDFDFVWQTVRAFCTID